MIIIYSGRNGIPIRLTQERWAHIVSRHPEMKAEREKVIQTVSEPEFIQEGDSGDLLAVRFFSKTPLSQKYLIVAYRELPPHDGFILTAYFTNLPSQRRRTIWKH